MAEVTYFVSNYWETVIAVDSSLKLKPQAMPSRHHNETGWGRCVASLVDGTTKHSSRIRIAKSQSKSSIFQALA